MKQKLLLLAAVFFGVLAFMFTFQQINQEKRKIMESAVDVDVIRLIHELSAGEKIKESDIEKYTVKRFAGSTLSSEIPWKQKDNILDLPVRSHLPANRILAWNDFDDRIAPGQTGMTAIVRPGFRAISVPVDTVSSVTGLIRPNNYVDLIGTFRFPDARGDAALDTVTLTILQHVKVLACGTDMGRISAGMNNPSARSYSTVTLELTPKEVEMIVFAMQKGHLTLSLRSFEESETTGDLQSVNWSYLQKNIPKYMKERELKMKKMVR
jgi:pilus assembly protein CpaB